MLVLFIYFQNNTILSKIVHFLCIKNKIKDFDRLFKLKILKIEISHLFQCFILNKACAFLRKNMKWTHYIPRSSLVFVIKKHYMQRTSIFLSKAMHLLHCAYILRWEMHNLKESLVQDSTFLVTDLVNFWYNDPETSLVSSYQKWLQTRNIWVSCARFVYLFSK